VEKTALSIAAAISIGARTAGFAAELPTYEVNGFPISPVQLQVLGGTNVREQLAASTVMTSPGQQGVATPLPKLNTATAAPITPGPVADPALKADAKRTLPDVGN
jgi:hypothetical protein